MNSTPSLAFSHINTVIINGRRNYGIDAVRAFRIVTLAIVLAVAVVPILLSRIVKDVLHSRCVQSL